MGKCRLANSLGSTSNTPHSREINDEDPRQDGGDTTADSSTADQTETVLGFWDTMETVGRFWVDFSIVFVAVALSPSQFVAKRLMM